MRSRSVPRALLEPKITVIKRKYTANVDYIYCSVENAITGHYTLDSWYCRIEILDIFGPAQLKDKLETPPYNLPYIWLGISTRSKLLIKKRYTKMTGLVERF